VVALANQNCSLLEIKIFLFICKLRSLGPNSAGNLHQTSARTRYVKPGPTYNFAWGIWGQLKIEPPHITIFYHLKTFRLVEASSNSIRHETSSNSNRGSVFAVVPQVLLLQIKLIWKAFLEAFYLQHGQTI